VPIAAVIVTYVLASISFPYWIARAYGVDLRAVGERKLGGGNLTKSVRAHTGHRGRGARRREGFPGGNGGALLGLELDAQLACGIAALVGQMWPVFHQFDGGRANATGWGFALAADPIAALIMGVRSTSAFSWYGWSIRGRPGAPLASILSFAIFPAVIWEQRARRRRSSPA